MTPLAMALENRFDIFMKGHRRDVRCRLWAAIISACTEIGLRVRGIRTSGGKCEPDNQKRSIPLGVHYLEVS